MAISGSGTQQDPYIVTTITELFTVLETQASTYQYIKLTSDIDCADDPNYTGEVTVPIQIYKTKLYSDNGANIIGLTITASSFLTTQYGSSNDSGELENINFIDCRWRYGSNSSVIRGASTSYTLTVTNCKFSLYIHNAPLSGSTRTDLFYNCNVTDCAGYFYFTGTNYVQLGAHGKNQTFLNSNFIIENANINNDNGGGWWNWSYNEGQGTAIDCSVILKRCHWINNSSSGYNITLLGDNTKSPVGGSYFACVDCTYLNAIGFRGSKSDVAQNDNGLSLFSTDDTTLPLVNDSYDSVKPIRNTQLKDANYLMQIGFL